MYRIKLAKYLGKRITLRCTIDLYGCKKFLVKQVKELSGSILTDHLWIRYDQRIGDWPYRTKPGKEIFVRGEVSTYQKENGAQDFCLTEISYIKG